MPVLLQTEAAECGLACLAMIANHWGHRIDLAAVRRRSSVSLKGVTLKGLMGIAHALNLSTRPLKLDLQHLSDLKFPCVLHWDMNHFVVAKGIGRKGLLIVDPSVGERRVPMVEVSRRFTGIALEIQPNAEFRAVEERQQFTLRSLMGRVVGLKRGLVQMLTLGIALQVCLLAAPFYMQWVVDEAVVASDYDLVTVLGIGFLLLTVVQAVLSGARSWITTVLASNLNFQWLGNVFWHLLHLPLPYFEKRHLGDIVSRFSSIQTIQRSVTTQFVEAILDGLLVVGALVVMLLYSATLTAVTVGAVALYAVGRWATFRSYRDANAQQIVHGAKQQTHFLESIRGIQSIRLFDRSQERRIGWLNTLADQVNSELRISRLSISNQTASSLIFSSERVIVIWLAALAVMDAKFSVGMLFAFISYKDQFSQRTAALIDKLFELRMLRVHGERVADIVLTEPEAQVAPPEPEAQVIEPALEMRNVSFRYSDSEPFVLKDLNLRIPAGQCIAITGVSGSGKTTLIKLLLGLLPPTSGDVFVGGVNLKVLGVGNFRQMVGAVMQDDHLFSGSIADNIEFFDAEPDRKRAEESAKLAAVHDEIVAMPMAYSTLIGDIGTGLSGGQRQRILLARALYKQPKVLVLDEATSHLDVWNEQLVNAAIKQICLTRVLVAHRPETIAMAQRVVVLEHGRVVRDLETSQLVPMGAASQS
jgi:ATP-binding cassette subfamily B protein RaxB